MSTLSTHVLDTALGRPAAGIRVTLHDSGDAAIFSAVTDDDGRVKEVGASLAQGVYRLRFDIDEYFRRMGGDAFYDEICISFRVGNEAHYHVPLLLSPFGYSTYRGS